MPVPPAVQTLLCCGEQLADELLLQEHPEQPCLQGVHLYDTQTCAPTAVFSHHTPVLDATFQDDGTVLSGGLDGLIKQ